MFGLTVCLIDWILLPSLKFTVPYIVVPTDAFRLYCLNARLF